MRICICDDDERDIEYCKNMILDELNPEDVDISVYHSGEALLFNSDTNINMYDVIFMDIEMKKINGIDTITKMREKGYTGDVIYLTSILDYVFDSFETNPLNYLIKRDNNTDKFKRVLEVAVNNSKLRKEKYIYLSNNGEKYRINKNEVMYIESKGRKVYVNMENGDKYSCYCKLSDILEKLRGKNFLRVHKSFIINSKFIIKIKSSSLFIKNNVEIPIGRSYIKEIQDTISLSLDKV